MPGFSQVLALQKGFCRFALIGARNFLHPVFGFEQDRALVGFMFAPEALIRNGDAKKSRKAKGFISSDFFKMPSKPLRSHVDTKNSLCQRPGDFGLVFLSITFSEYGEGGIEPFDKSLDVASFKGLKPIGARSGIRKR